MPHLEHLDLFSGIGGFALAGQVVGGIKTSQFVEIDPFCQERLNESFPGVPVHADIRTFNPAQEFDLVTAGFPCQDISGANPSGRGLEGERSGLFFEVMRIIRHCRPRFVVLENVSALLRKNRGRDMGRILWELSQSGFDAEWQTLPASVVGAPQLRERVFIVAYSSSERRHDGGSSNSKYEVPIHEEWHSTQSVRSWDGWKCWLKSFHSTGNWFIAPSKLSGMDDGVSNRLDRIKALGNSVSPQVASIPLARVLQLSSANT